MYCFLTKYKLIRCYFIILLLIASACNNKSTNSISELKSDKEINQKNDTSDANTKSENQKYKDKINNNLKEKSLRIKGHSVIFFMPEPKELEDIIKTNLYSKWEFTSIINNFKATANSTAKQLKKKNIFSKLTNASYFEIEMDTGGVIIFDRITEDQLMGHIISDGKKEPIINYGLYKNSELKDLIIDFFEIESYENIELDSLEKIQEKQYEQTDSTNAENL